MTPAVSFGHRRDCETSAEVEIAQKIPHFAGVVAAVRGVAVAELSSVVSPETFHLSARRGNAGEPGTAFNGAVHEAAAQFDGVQEIPHFTALGADIAAVALTELTERIRAPALYVADVADSARVVLSADDVVRSE